MRKIFIVCFLGIFSTLQSQENYHFSKVDLELLLNADAIIREYDLIIEINDIDEIEISTSRVVTVLNKSGQRYIDAYENFDKGISILDQEAIIFDKSGEEIKRFKKRDFSTRSNFQDFVLFSDNMVSYLDYTPRQYPYTVKYTSRVRRGNSIFLPDWRPLEGYEVSIEKSSYKIKNDAGIPIRYAERNLDSLNVLSKNSDDELDYSVTNIPARTYEEYSPDFENTAPRVLIALEEYALEGIIGKSDNWGDFGKWQYENLVEGRDHLSEVIVRKISQLTQYAETTEEKARIIYKYVQDNTRYIAVMLGIGGWKPYSADEVDRLGYGDCKGLTNYTKALLASQGIASDYTVIYGGPKRNIDPEFTKMQGNHVILSIPQEGKDDIWLECTNQDIPFNYLGDFTDDRYALKVKPTGGEIVRTPKYTAEDNLKLTNAEVFLNASGGFKADIERKSYGIPYGDIYLIELQTKDIQKNFYRENWSHFQNIKFEEISYKNDKREIEFVENLKFEADRFCINAGDRLLIPLNFITSGKLGLEEDKNRKNTIKISRGKSFRDSFSFHLPEDYVIEALPKDREIESEFGKIGFKTEVVEGNDGTKLVVRKYLKIEEGEWKPEKFEKFREFRNQINKINNQKAVIVSTSKI